MLKEGNNLPIFNHALWLLEYPHPSWHLPAHLLGVNLFRKNIVYCRIIVKLMIGQEFF